MSFFSAFKWTLTILSKLNVRSKQWLNGSIKCYFEAHFESQLNLNSIITCQSNIALILKILLANFGSSRTKLRAANNVLWLANAMKCKWTKKIVDGTHKQDLKIRPKFLKIIYGTLHELNITGSYCLCQSEYKGGVSDF